MSAQGQVYQWDGLRPPQSHSYLFPRLKAIVAARDWPKRASALDFGCGNGFLTNWLSGEGFRAVGFDLSKSGIEVASRAYPAISFSTDTSAENIARSGPYDLALCIEVIAHCFEPDAEAKKIFDNLKPGGMLILATPYYGYLKNLVLAITGGLTQHRSVASSATYVSLFTIANISQLLRDAGFTDVEVARVGRIPPLAKVMLVTARKP